MVTKEQEQQVTDYLILHKLPLDILLEVKDHMISQVLDIQSSENLTFEEAFHKTQKLWESEFKMTKYSVFYQEEIPVIVKKIVKTRYNNLLKKSLMIGIISFVINLVFIYLADNQEVYVDIFRFYNSLFVLTPFIVWIFNYKMRKYIRTDFKYQGKLFYTMYQQNMGLYVVSVNITFQLILRDNQYAFQFFRTENHVGVFPLIISLFLPFILQMIVIFVMLNFSQHKKSLEKMKDFIGLSTE